MEFKWKREKNVVAPTQVVHSGCDNGLFLVADDRSDDITITLYWRQKEKERLFPIVAKSHN